MEIDLNCDLGEGCGHDAELLELITTANIACGFHAGDAEIAATTIQSARQHGVQLGAHPSFADREHFGRREIDLTPQQVFHLCVYQIGALAALAKAYDALLSHIKPHGALYNMACRDERVAKPIVDAACLMNLPIMGLPDSTLEICCVDRVEFIPEGFADRRYLADGSLVSRSESDAFVEDTTEAVKQADWLITNRGVRTICVHGDNPQAVEFVRTLRRSLVEQGIVIRAFA